MNPKNMTKNEVLSLIANAIGVPAERITDRSVAADFAEWDSMGTLALLAVLDRGGVAMEPGDGAALQAVQGVLEAVRKAGRLAS